MLSQYDKYLNRHPDTPRFKLCAILQVGKDRIIGYNRTKTNPKTPHKWQCSHAETDAIMKALQRGATPSKLKKATLTVVRKRKIANSGKDEFCLAKPCKECKDFIQKFQIETYYTNDRGDMIRL